MAPKAKTFGSPLAAWDGSYDVSVLAQRFGSLPADRPYLLARVLNLAVVHQGRVRILRGTVKRMLIGTDVRIVHTSGLVLGQIDISQVVGWATGEPTLLEAYTLKALAAIRAELAVAPHAPVRSFALAA